MDYLSSLRQYIGHAPLLMAGAATLIVDEQERLLLLRRLDNNRWGPPGGAVEPGEVVEQAAWRELLQSMQVSALFFVLASLGRICG